MRSANFARLWGPTHGSNAPRHINPIFTKPAIVATSTAALLLLQSASVASPQRHLLCMQAQVLPLGRPTMLRQRRWWTRVHLRLQKSWPRGSSPSSCTACSCWAWVRLRSLHTQDNAGSRKQDHVVVQSMCLLCVADNNSRCACAGPQKYPYLPSDLQGAGD